MGHSIHKYVVIDVMGNTATVWAFTMAEAAQKAKDLSRVLRAVRIPRFQHEFPRRKR